LSILFSGSLYHIRIRRKLLRNYRILPAYMNKKKPFGFGSFKPDFAPARLVYK